MCDLSDSQAGQSHRRLEGVCAAVSQRERRVTHRSPRQHQSITEQEQAHVRHLLVDPDQSTRHSMRPTGFAPSWFLELPESWRYLSESGICSSGLLSRAASWVMIRRLFPSLSSCTHTHTHKLITSTTPTTWVSFLCSVCLPDSLGSSAARPPSARLAQSYVLTAAEENRCVHGATHTHAADSY